tara:strand:- start:186 stop:851 length:666 start_codon:yes stop_codon:yes gene_type:complete
MDMDADTARKALLGYANEKMTTISSIFTNAGLNASIGTKFINNTIGAPENLSAATYRKLFQHYPDLKFEKKQNSFIRLRNGYLVGGHTIIEAVAMPDNQFIALNTTLLNSDEIQNTFKAISWGKFVTSPFFNGAYGLYQEIDCRDSINHTDLPIVVIATEEKIYCSFARLHKTGSRCYVSLLKTNGDHFLNIALDNIVFCYNVELIIPQTIGIHSGGIISS